MLIKREHACAQFTANDGCRIRELLQQIEAYYILEGTGMAWVAGECAPVARGDVVFIPAGDEQWIENTGEGTLKFAAIVAPPWRAEDDERLD